MTPPSPAPRRRSRGWVRAAAGTAAVGTATIAAALAAGAIARAQTVDVERPRTLVVGTPAAGVRTDRGDSARTGRSPTPLPLALNGGLRVEWKTVVSASIDVAPVVDDRGTTYVVGTRGEVFAVARDASESWHLATGAVLPGAPVLLSDDTLVLADAMGEAVALRGGAVRWRTRFGRADPLRPTPPSPLALDDGGVAVATTHELAVLDADGHERARTTLPEPTRAPLVAAAALGQIVAVTTSGAVWTWAPGAAEMSRVGSFGGPIDDGAALVDDHTLVALTSGRQHLVALDLIRGTTLTRAVAPTGLWLGPPTTAAGITHLVLQGLTGELTVALDASGTETERAALTTHPPPLATDGGAAPLVALPHAPLLVDAAGSVAFATSEGGVGVVAGGVVDLLPDACPPAPGGRSASATTALVALGPRGLLAVCRAGTLVAIRGGGPAPARP